MLDFNHVLSTPGYNLQYFQGPATTTLIQWQLWRKPRGVTMVYLIGVGGGSSGGTGVNTSTTSGGGAGGNSGGQSSVLIPAMFLPDTLYIQCGSGGQGPTSSGAAGVIGVPTYVCIAPDTTLVANDTLLFANAGPVTGAVATTTTGGAAGSAAAVATIANMPLAGRGFSTFFAGQAGTAGGANGAAGTSLTPPATGLMVTGGTGGGGSGAAAAGGAINAVSNILGQDMFSTIAGGIASPGSTPAGSGASFITKNYIMNYGGTGGGGAGASGGGLAGIGATGSPGCGGGGGGGATSTNTTNLKGGDGGPGFVIIVSW